MSGKNKDEGGISLIDAVETLSNIADLEFDRSMGIEQVHEMVIQGQTISYKTVHWLHQKDANETVEIVREIFKVVLHYLKDFYKEEYSLISNQKALEGIKTIMVLVGEAAKKLDKYSDFFKERKIKSVTELKEYKQLQEFYRSKIDRKIDEGILGRWILALANRGVGRTRAVKVIDRKIGQTKHIFVDLDSVKKDTEYELFFMRKEDGSRFFSPRLIRNIKLVCDFGDYFSKKEQDPYEEIQYVYDKYSQITAKNIIKVLKIPLERFYADVSKIRDHELIDDLKMCFMALYLCANPSNLLEYNPIKTCSDYLEDFQFFLRRAINTRDYQKLVAYPPKKTNKVGTFLLNMVRNLCQTLFIHLQSYHDLIPVMEDLVQKSRKIVNKNNEESKKSLYLWDRLTHDYASMSKALKFHPHGPLVKVIDRLQDAGHIEFDTYMQGNLPGHWFDIITEEKTISHERMPCPTRQEFINKTYVTEEFKEFMRSYNDQHKQHLMFNMQDRTSWREHFRCAAVEEMQNHPDFKDQLTVVTLATDTDFYHQLAPYNQVNHANVFVSQFKELLKDEHSGYFFPKKLKRSFDNFIDDLIDEVHQQFFNSRNVLLREARLDFIQIVHLFLQLKIIDLVNPDSFSFTCKDCVDIAPSNTALLFLFLKMLNQHKLEEEDLRFLDWVLYAPSTMIRGRIMIPERFNRMAGALKVIENKSDELGYVQFEKLIQDKFGKLFKRPLLKGFINTKKLHNIKM